MRHVINHIGFTCLQDPELDNHQEMLVEVVNNNEILENNGLLESVIILDKRRKNIPSTPKPSLSIFSSATSFTPSHKELSYGLFFNRFIEMFGTNKNHIKE